MEESIVMLSLDDKSLTTELDRSGYRSMGVLVKRAGSYEELSRIIDSEKVDIVVINIDFAKINAKTVVSSLKTAKESADIPIIVTSVRSDTKMKKELIAAGAEIFVEQPVPRQLFIEKVKKLLEKNTRNNERVNIRGTEASVQLEKGSFSCAIEDMSTSGMLLATEEKMPDGSLVELEFVLPGYKRPVRVEGEVVRTVRLKEKVNDIESGVGIRFKSFKGDSEKKIERYIEKSAHSDLKMAYYL